MNALDSFCSWISEINTAVSVHVFVLVMLSMPVFTFRCDNLTRHG